MSHGNEDNCSARCEPAIGSKGVEMFRGSRRDAFEHRMEAQYARFYAAEVEHIRKWVERWDLEPVFLAGPPKGGEIVWNDLPKALKARTVLVPEGPPHLPR